MSQSDLHLKLAFDDAFRQLCNGRRQIRPGIAAIEVRFYPYAGLHHTIRVRSGRVFVRISDLLRAAPPEVIRALAFLLVARLLSRKTPRVHEQIYRSYAFSADVLRASDIARRHRGRKVISTAAGRVYDLNRIFHRVNRRYFNSEIAKPVLTWSQRKTRSILGHHDAAHDTITVSKTLDSHDVPTSNTRLASSMDAATITHAHFARKRKAFRTMCRHNSGLIVSCARAAKCEPAQHESQQ
jgi:hypothetical protein